jgi:hypothetical protein
MLVALAFIMIGWDPIDILNIVIPNHIAGVIDNVVDFVVDNVGQFHLREAEELEAKERATKNSRLSHLSHPPPPQDLTLGGSCFTNNYLS